MRAKRRGKEGNMMKKLEKMVRRTLHWAEEYRRSGDVEGVAFAMQRYRRAARALQRRLDAAFAPRMDFAMGGQA